MIEKFDFHDLFVFDLANNHQGSLEHGVRIIREVAQVARENAIRAALKFQFRQLDTIIHPAHLQRSDNKHIPRFLSTRLSKQDFAVLAEEVRKGSLITMATPFDEESVDLILDLAIAVVKIASCSATDWPLIEKIAECGNPVVCSTGGLTLKQIDDLGSFFDHRHVHFALMHCVAIYPTPDDKMQLGQIELLRKRYPHLVIGFSTHEDPADTVPVQIAFAKGARIFERHVGIATDEIKLNAYSSTPEQIDRWLKAYKKAKALCGMPNERPSATDEEMASLETLRRGVYARKLLKEGVRIERGDVYFAMPCTSGQLYSGEWKEGLIAYTNIETDQPLERVALKIPQNLEAQELYTAIHMVKAMLNEARVAVPSDFKVEISHHYGMANFRKVGAVIIDCVNRSYCKKLVVQLPRQYHPSHYHKRKEETFQVLYGVLELKLDDRRKTLYPGDTLLIQPGVWHEFWTETGAIFEEISTTHFNDDSYYEDKAINRLERSARKTTVEHWGRHQIE
jgi:N-acetylneuraminate synthase